MRIAVVGAGAVGGYYGGRLAQAGEDVIFIARGENLRALRENGLRVESVRGDFTLPHVQATDDPSGIGSVDTILLCVKTWQMPAALQSIRPLVGAGTAVLTLQNGVEAPGEVEATLGQGHALAGLVVLFSNLAAPGVVRHTGGPALIAFGEPDNHRSERVERLLGAFQHAQGVTAESRADIQAALWEKFLFITAFASVGAVSRAPVGILRSLPETRAMLRGCMEEIAAVAAARGVRLSAGIIEKTLAFIDAQPSAGQASMQRDILNGRRSELDALTGAVVRLGAEVGVATPLHTTIYHALLPQEQLARGELVYPA
ncbi:MAG TPA: 2-dehydropantoate 2-reductase [Anaerolineaceae bacterium]